MSDLEYVKKSLKYLKENNKNPYEYVLEKLEKNSVVLLMEDHGIKENLTFCKNLLKKLHEKGIYNFGMEFGAQENQKELDELINAAEYDENKARKIMRNYNAMWAYKEYMDIYKEAWEIKI